MSFEKYPHYYNSGIKNLKYKSNTEGSQFYFNSKPSGSIPTNVNRCLNLLNNTNAMLGELMIKEELKDSNKQREMIKEIKNLINQSQQDLSKDLDKNKILDSIGKIELKIN